MSQSHKEDTEGLKDGPFPRILSAEFFVMRTPLLPIEELLSWSSGLTACKMSGCRSEDASSKDVGVQDRVLLRERLRALVDRPEVKQALFIASPSLLRGIDYWKRDPDSKRGLQAERSIVRYFARMSCRSTPFGLFSGYSLGSVECGNGSRTVLELTDRSSYLPTSRLDFDYLFALSRRLQRDPAVASELYYWPNSSLVRRGPFWHYVEPRVEGSVYTHHAVRVETDSYLEAAVKCASRGAKISNIVEALCRGGEDPDVSEADIREYVGELIGNAVLVSSLTPLVTGDALDDIISQLEPLSDVTHVAVDLKRAKRALAEVDRQGVGARLDEYEAIAANLRTLSPECDLSRLYQVDLTKPVVKATLGPRVIEEMVQGIGVLCGLQSSIEPEALTGFRNAFLERYDRAAVPLLEVLDEEIGIGFGMSTHDGSPILQGLDIGNRPASMQRTQVEDFRARLLNKVIAQTEWDQRELELDIADIPKRSDAYQWLPNSFSIIATIVTSSDGSCDHEPFDVWIKSLAGPSGARLLGRFCHTNQALENAVRRYVREEEAHEPEVLFAEIVHLPEGRIGNVLSRPILRDHELVYLGRSGASLDRQITAAELLVFIERQEIILYSERLDRRIVPRLTNAHGFWNPKLSAVYRFLCMLQHQHGVSCPTFGWGQLEALDYLPRLKVGRTIFSTARWRLRTWEVKRLTQSNGVDSFLYMQEIRQQRAMPRWIVFEEFDNSLPVDLENVLSVEAFVHVLKRGSPAIVREMYPSPDDLCVRGPEGCFYHEVNVPFHRQLEPKVRNGEWRNPTSKASGAVRRIALGGEWLYIKIYGGSVILDEMLGSTLPAFLLNSITSSVVRRWFFVRYSDPGFHLRLRFNGEPGDLIKLIPMFSRMLDPLLTLGRIWKIEYDTYDREIERYGGGEGAMCSEDLFFADSEAVLEILQGLDSQSGMEQRWKIALLGIDRLLTDFDFSLERKVQFMEELRPSRNWRKVLGEKFRRYRNSLERLFDPESEEGKLLLFATKAFNNRSIMVSAVSSKLSSLEEAGRLSVDVNNLIRSYTHMHVNRICRARPNQHESVIYEFLFRMYDGQLARRRRETQA